VLIHLAPVGADGVAAGSRTLRRGRIHSVNLPVP
jgi:hypothetical protein